MSKIDDKYFSFIPFRNGYNYQDKSANVVMYVKYMINRSLAMFKYHNLPGTIPVEELEKMLQCAGGAVWYKHSDGELYVFNATLGGEGDVYNRPTKAIISNPALKLNKEVTLNEECVFMQNDSMCMGLLPMYQKYCTMLNETDITIILATINKRVQMLLSANDDNTVASAKQFIKDIENGKLGVIAESKLFESLKTNTVATSNTNSLQDIYQLQQYIKASLFNEIGLGANWNSKKERFAVAEIETNSDNLYPLVDDMLNNRRSALEKVNEMYGTDITVEFNSSWDYRLYSGENIDTLQDDNINDESIEPTEETDIEPVETSVEPTDEPTDEPTQETTDEPTEETSVENGGGTDEAETPERGGETETDNEHEETATDDEPTEQETETVEKKEGGEDDEKDRD